MRFDNQLRHALHIIDAYQGDLPLHVWLKNYFREHKQMGARDRRLQSDMVYAYYRLGHALKHLSTADRLLAGFFLCNDEHSDLLRHFRPAWDPTAPLTEKIAFFQRQPESTAFRVTDIFPWPEDLSPGIDHETFCLSFLRQPDLYLRIRPGHKDAVLEKLRTVPHEFLPPVTVRLPNGVKVEDYFIPDREIVIQDYSSQQVAQFLQSTRAPRSFWDTCAASGGKSILAHDLYPDMLLTVSDIRESILLNLRTRFRAAGIENYDSFLIDLAIQSPPNQTAGADLVLSDVPCTGSGTWSRTPEQLYFFRQGKLLHYSELQKKILRHVVPYLALDASLIYCTCSVFKKENEGIVAFIRDDLGLSLHRSSPIEGYRYRADTLFAARFSVNYDSPSSESA